MENKINGLMFSVAVITYNQEKYIAQTLDSIINQRHNYSYEIVVGDDCSSDGTREIVRQYAEKYPEIVTVYTIGDVSKELCGGPHVENTKELGKFKIKKEESSSSGVRRIKAILIKD